MAEAARNEPSAGALLRRTGEVRALRAELVAEEVPLFDAELRQAMAEATDALDLDPVLGFLRRWSRLAASTREDPQAHRAMLARVREYTASPQVNDQPAPRTVATSA